jgi:hypothetical protein
MIPLARVLSCGPSHANTYTLDGEICESAAGGHGFDDHRQAANLCEIANESANVSTRSANELANVSTNVSANESTNESANESAKESANESAHESAKLVERTARSHGVDDHRQFPQRCEIRLSKPTVSEFSHLSRYDSRGASTRMLSCHRFCTCPLGRTDSNVVLTILFLDRFNVDTTVACLRTIVPFMAALRCARAVVGRTAI